MKVITPRTLSAVLFTAVLCSIANVGLGAAKKIGKDVYKVGASKVDITGPVAQVVMTGYADFSHISSGLLNRLFCRAFVIEDAEGSRLLLVHTDTHSLPVAVHEHVLASLESRYGRLYTSDNFILHSQHTHSGSNGAHTDFLWYTVFAAGFRQEYFDSVVGKIVKAVRLAHENMEESKLLITRQALENANVQRSPDAYAANPAAERAQYKSETNTEMTLVQVVSNKEKDEEGRPKLRAIWSFFPVHTTSFTQLNNMINPDNKGYAQWVLERKYKGVVAAFFQTNHGDTSPNLVDNHDGTFAGEGRTDVEHAEIIGRRQARVAELALRDTNTWKYVKGPIRSAAEFVDFAAVELDGGRQTCPAVIGLATLAGTEDGRGLSLIHEGFTMSLKANNTFVAIKADIAEFIAKGVFSAPSADEKLIQCQGAKIPFIATGLSDPPLTPHVFPVKVARIGSFVLSALPFEVTTMAGRRIQATLKKALTKKGVKDPLVEVLSLCNGYGGYLTTKEEYSRQHYEGASTHFGPLQLEAVQQRMDYLAQWMEGSKLPRSPATAMPVDFSTLHHTPLASRPLDTRIPPAWMQYGKAVEDTRLAPYMVGEMASATFWCAYPANSQASFVPSFCDVEVYDPKLKRYQRHLGDDDWNVRFVWRRKYLYYSVCSCEWHIELQALYPSAGGHKYRLAIKGAHEAANGAVLNYTGHSKPFKVNTIDRPLRMHEHNDVSHYKVYLPDEVTVVLSIVILALFTVVRKCCCCTSRKTLPK